MKVSPIRTPRVTAGAMRLMDLINTSVDHVPERSVLAITSKVVSLCENRVVSPDQATKSALVEEEADWYLPEVSDHGVYFTITRGALVPSSGIDESNGGGDLVLWPRDPQASADHVWHHLRARFALERVGVVITDSTCTPLRRGTTGICLAHSGFHAVNDYRGQPDLFDRPFRVGEANVTGGLAAAAVLVMGEGTEQTPLCLVEDVPLARFQDHAPTDEELGADRIEAPDDLFAPFLSAVRWAEGRGRSKRVS